MGTKEGRSASDAKCFGRVCSARQWVSKQVGCRIDDTEASSRNVLSVSERVVVGANSDVVE